ncbi:prolipoprotein diacylglyceryl transferase [Muricauda sp. SCSIO 64092]|uniref:prolipoprotein diacylglyceryl transferase n=1 Tax=Allomuricauda sp. SCSIO 64092 TaxID=2908842 RepID=UPI001FF40C6E|nr:prolipoprotein diacylglyceryl transferase [Muricauda sp. SCSIO 64092]UOY05437.1 prolipoprotein diacylglyceryl transferase [Muricauda sp. SCSIO 64092]
MHFLGFIWNPDETIFQIGVLQIKYYNLLWILAFVLGWYIMKRIFQNENISLVKLDSLFVYAVVSIMLGARLGHVLFYQSELFVDDPLSILLPIQTTPEFKFTGFAGLASHGAAIGGIIGLYLFSRKNKGMSILWLLDRVTITCAIGGAFVRLGNFFNSEINGKIVDKSFALATKFIRDSDDMPAYKAMQLTKEKTASAAYRALENNPDFSSVLESIPYRHPVQLYEAFGYLLLFVIMYFWMYWKTDLKKKEGFLFGFWLAVMWGPIRFILEFFKKSQGGFEDTWGTFSTGQWLSIPFVLIGLYLMFRPVRK